MRANSAARLVCRTRPALGVRALPAVVAALLVIAGLGAHQGAVAQTTTSVSPIELRLVPVVQVGTTPSSLPLGGQILQVVVFNGGSSPVVNQQVVVRVPVAPAVITQVNEQASPVGVVDARTGFWYHTIAQLNPGSSSTFTVTWFTPCAGRWPLVARVGDRRTSTSVQLVGVSALSCPPDELAVPIVPSYLDLPWPPTLASSTTTSTTSTTSTTLAGSVQPSATAPTLPGASSTLPPLLQLPAPTSTTSTTTTTKPSTVRKPAPTATTIIICKTVGGRRYCGPQSSVYKPGQKKAIETKAKTTKKTVKKTVKK